jgi:NAD(P)-dependent dehydrogenase (short-subunit alcohol dehydrogenase family)
MLSNIKGQWALILGASSGFGEAISKKLAENGVNIIGVHLDRKNTMAHVEEVVSYIRSKNVKALFFNANAADPEKRKEILDTIAKETEGGVNCLVHSLAFGTLKPFISSETKDRISRDQMEMTLDVMANSLVYWTQDLFEKKLLKQGAKIFGMTSSGGTRVFATYGAVSAAKAALESHCRQLSLELAPHKISVNAIRAGVTDTPALRKIPGHEKMIGFATERNPWGRLTEPNDVANAILLLMHPEAQWITGNVLGVDGGEDVVA